MIVDSASSLGVHSMYYPMEHESGTETLPHNVMFRWAPPYTFLDSQAWSPLVFIQGITSDIATLLLPLECFVRQAFCGRRSNLLRLLKTSLQHILIPNCQLHVERRSDRIRVCRVFLVPNVIDVSGHRLALCKFEGENQSAVHGVQHPVGEIHCRAHASTGAKGEVQRRWNLAVFTDPALRAELVGIRSVDARV